VFPDEKHIPTTLGEEIACVILEPVKYNSGTIQPLPGYLDLLRRLTMEHGALLIFFIFFLTKGNYYGFIGGKFQH